MSSGSQAPRLNRTLGTLDVTLLGIGAIVGGGVFASIGTAAVGTQQRLGAGPSLILSSVLTAFVCTFSAMCYSELACRVPAAGSAYAYGRLAFGRLAAWLIGWTLTLEYGVANVAVASSWGSYMHGLLGALGCQVPRWLATDWQSAQHSAAMVPPMHTGGVVFSGNVFAGFIVLAVTCLLVRGLRASSRINNALVLFKIAVLLLFVGLAAALIPPQEMLQNWQPFFPNGTAGTWQGAAVIFFSYIGFDSITTLSEETKDPRRSIPVGIMTSLAVCAALYMAVAAAFTGLAPLPQMAERLAGAVSQPLTLALQLLGPKAAWANLLVAAGALVAQTTAILAFQVAQARIFFAMSRDGLLPQVFSRVHPHFGTPHVATWVAGILVAGCSIFLRMDDMLDLTDVGTLSIFCVTCLAVPVLRRTQGNDPSPHPGFRVPGGPWLFPVLGAASCLMLMSHVPTSAWLALAAWLALGLLIYGGYGMRYSKKLSIT